MIQFDSYSSKGLKPPTCYLLNRNEDFLPLFWDLDASALDLVVLSFDEIFDSVIGVAEYKSQSHTRKDSMFSIVSVSCYILYTECSDVI